jgi:fermentation-respiration switch protein FrsA (DUF1100 family)
MSISVCTIALGALSLGLFLTATTNAGSAAPASRPSKASEDAAGKKEVSGVSNGWTPKPFDYTRPDKLIVEESTPTAAQVSWVGRPPRLPVTPPDPVARAKAKPRIEGPMDVVRLTFKDVDGEVVPALLCTPKDAKGPFPVVVAVHGLTSNKAQVTAQVGPALARKGFAVLALDLPRHGERPGEPLSVLDTSRPEKTFAIAKQAVNDVRQLIDIAETRPELDTKAGVTLAGYSLGSWISAVVGPSDPRVKQMVLMVGGAVDVPAAMMLLPQVRATDPRLAIAHFAGRPVLMLNGKADDIVKPDWAERLFAAVPEPKKQVWYDSGHLLPAGAYEDAAEWIAGTVEKAGKGIGAKVGAAGTPQRKAG